MVTYQLSRWGMMVFHWATEKALACSTHGVALRTTKGVPGICEEVTSFKSARE